MYTHVLILPDGREISSGTNQEQALQSVTVTQMVNQGEELTLGSACACELQAELITPYGSLSLAAGDRVTLLREDEAGNRTPMGVFWLEKPEFPTAHTMRFTAYDSVSRLDVDLTGWLAELNEWPYSVGEFAGMVCHQCGLELVETELPNEDFYIEAFAGESITGRHLIQWLGQITGRFCRSTADGSLEFSWYCPNDGVSVAPEEGNGQVFYYQGELTYADYTVAPVEKVQLRENSQDVGTIWPNETGEKNTYILQNNPMLAAQNGQTLTGVAQRLYEQLQTATYTPLRVTIPATPEIIPGDIITVIDGNGNRFTTWVMKKTANGQRDILESTGSHRRDSTTAVNDLGFRSLSGKVLNLKTDVDGLKLENKNTQGKLAAVELDLEGIRSRVESQEASNQTIMTAVSTITQTAESLQLQLYTLREDGTQKVKTQTGYTFDDQGLHIAGSYSDMANLLNHKGMCVSRNGEILLQADNQGVLARDVNVGNYLIIGENARFEDYGGSRTACYYIG